MSQPYALVFMGVSGSGKTTAAQAFAEKMGWPFAEADEFHPKANVDKMSQGIALNDDDRWPWLRDIRDWISQKSHEGTSVVLTCSALKKSYRVLLEEADADVRFVLLDADREVLKERMLHRENHYMPASLLDSQLATLEPLEADEPGVIIDSQHPPEQIIAKTLEYLGI
ncbi:gluconokinase [Carnimonas nigrificans]|uniref:gluconokinase n=1 Tax=Carnimonas nigrificans TaxID=64323 RepID=UPI000470C644|nr:gluconokinase [Carnimonas nigrificans]